MEFIHKEDPRRIVSEKPIAVIYPNSSLFLSGDYTLDEITEIGEVARNNFEIDEVPRFNFAYMDTSLARQYDDNQLLRRIEGLKLFNGYGLVAELCKRFAREKGIVIGG
jgi:hypothetical protein